MRRVIGSAIAFAVVALLPQVSSAQDGPSRTVAGGGIKAAGWMGKVDAAEAAKGLKITDAKLEKMGDMYMVTTGPATTYWNPSMKATGNYTVKATFDEPKYMNLNDHPHPYGIMIAGNDLGSGKESFLYCSAYGNGTFIVRGFGVDTTGTSKVFSVNGRGVTKDTINVHRAAGKDQPVKQDIAIQVTADKVNCIINGATVGSYDKSAVVGAGKLPSTDGVYGLRFAHNTEVTVSGFTMTKN